MSEVSRMHEHKEITSLERTARLAEAANEVGGRIMILANQGEEYTHNRGGNHGRPRTSYTGEVPKDSAYISVEFPDANATPLYEKAEELADAKFMSENGIDPNSLK